MKIGCFIIIVFCLLGCNSRKRNIERLVREWTDKEILFPEYLETKVCGRDTACPEVFTMPYKILNYIDTSGCTECRLKLAEWKSLRHEAAGLGLPVAFVFVAWVPNYDELETMLRVEECDIPFLYDRFGKMQQLNGFPSIPGFQTFLLDSANRVKVVGNPLENDELWALYRQVMAQP